MSKEEKNENNPGLGVFHLGIILLFVIFCMIFCSVFVDPNILARFVQLELWQDVGKMFNISAKIVGYAFAILEILLLIFIAAKITNYGKR